MRSVLDVVIVNWNAGTHLRECVESVRKHDLGVVDRVIVVDNNSTDGSLAAVAGLPGVFVVEAGSNIGFSKACNLGAGGGDSEFLLFLNPDAALYEGTLAKTLRFMREPRNQRVGIFGVQLLDECGRVTRSCSRFPTPAGLVAHSIGLDRIFPRFGHVMAEWDHCHTMEVDHVMGAFFLVRRKVFAALGGFDERFFVYYEDLDFSLRARQRGWSSAYLADAQAFHAGGGTSRQVKGIRLFYSLQSRLLYAYKHSSLSRANMVLLTTVVLEPAIRTIRSLATFPRHPVRDVWTAYRMLWSWLRHRETRRQLHSGSCSTAGPG